MLPCYRSLIKALCPSSWVVHYSGLWVNFKPSEWFKILQRIPTVLAVSDIVLYCVFINGKPVVTKRSLKLFDSVDGVFNLISAATSLLATWTIARRIHLATRNEYIPRSRYQYIINICVGSSLCYSCAVVVTAIRDELSSAGVKVPLSYFAGNLYVSHLVTFLTVSFIY